MKANGCAEINDPCIAGTNGLAEPGKHRQYGFLIPAGALIGLGAGMLAGYAGPGVLAGVGLGLIGSELASLVRKPLVHEGMPQAGTNVTMLLIGAFLVFIGVGIVYAPAALWPYAVAGFFIVLGAWFLIRGFFHD